MAGSLPLAGLVRSDVRLSNHRPKGHSEGVVIARRHIAGLESLFLPQYVVERGCIDCVSKRGVAIAVKQTRPPSASTAPTRRWSGLPGRLVRWAAPAVWPRCAPRRPRYRGCPSAARGAVHDLAAVGADWPARVPPASVTAAITAMNVLRFAETPSMPEASCSRHGPINVGLEYAPYYRCQAPFVPFF